MSTETILLILLVIILIGALPRWGHSKSWGYTPTGVLTLLLVVYLIWALASGRPLFRSSSHSTGDEVAHSVQDAADAVKRTGRDAADAVRDAVQ